MSEIERRKVGRPAVNATPVTVRIPPDLLAWLDSERAHFDPVPSRPEIIRKILEEVKRNNG